MCSSHQSTHRCCQMIHVSRVSCWVMFAYSPTAGRFLSAHHTLPQRACGGFRSSSTASPRLRGVRPRPGHGVPPWEKAASGSRLGSGLLPHQVTPPLSSSKKVSVCRLSWTCTMCVCFTGRGGGEQGLAWQRAARMEGKPRGVDDLGACLLFLFSSGVSSPSLAALTACSAGAVPVGALCNRHPHLMRAVSLQVSQHYYWYWSI